MTVPEGCGPLAEAVADEPYVDLETVGRVTGRPHRVELWFGGRGSTVYFLAGGGDGAHWVRNLRREPRVVLHVGGRACPGTARLVSDEAEEQHARRLLAAKYQGWTEGSPLTRWARTSLPVAVDLDSAEPAAG